MIAVPVNFRLVAAEVAFVVEDAEASAVIAQDGLHGVIEEVRGGLSVPAPNYVHFGATLPGRLARLRGPARRCERWRARSEGDAR